MTIDVFQAITDLRAGWHSLHDLDKASQITALRGAGMSGRTLGQALGVSEALIRHLAHADEASPEEKQLARKGDLSTNELVRKVKLRRAGQAQRDREAQSRERNAATEEASKDVIGWLSSELQPAYAEQAIDEARRILVEAAAVGRLPKHKAPQGMSIAEIISRCQPRSSEEDDLNLLNRYARWLALWTFYAIPDALVRDRALCLAWSVMIRR